MAAVYAASAPRKAVTVASMGAASVAGGKLVDGGGHLFHHGLRGGVPGPGPGVGQHRRAVRGAAVRGAAVRGGSDVHPRGRGGIRAMRGISDIRAIRLHRGVPTAGARARQGGN